MLKAYGWSGWTGRDQYGNPYTQSLTSTINGVTTNVASIPLYFLRSGRNYSGLLHSVNNDGYYWSSTAYTASGAYSLFFNSSNVNPSNNSNRYNGNSVRCVAR